MKRIQSIVLCIITIIVCMSLCKKNETPSPQTTSLTIDESVTVVVGQTSTIKATVEPANAAITWESSNPEICTVENGVVTGVSKGTAMVSATSGEIRKVCKVIVIENLYNVTLTLNEVEIGTSGATYDCVISDDLAYYSVSCVLTSEMGTQEEMIAKSIAEMDELIALYATAGMSYTYSDFMLHGSQQQVFTGLKHQTDYTIYAFVMDTNTKEVYLYVTSSFTTEANASYAFSVGPNKQICFSSGNLQCQPSTQTWRFAANQYDVIGSDNSNCSMDYSGWIDLFGWSTSSTYYGICTSDNALNYNGDFVDWGNEMGEEWFTLTDDEFAYMTYERLNADQLYGAACVNGVNGCVVLPDSWTLPEGVTFTPGGAIGSGNDSFAQANNYTVEQWQIMESAGAVFLPCPGTRLGTDVSDVQYGGFYWSSLGAGDYYAGALQISSYAGMEPWACDRQNGNAVRLVREMVK